MKNISIFRIFFFSLMMPILMGLLVLSQAQAQEEAATTFIKRISMDVLNTAKTNANIDGDNLAHIQALVEKKIVPYIDFESMTKQAVGRSWSQANRQEQQELTEQFKILLIRTYSGALSQAQDKELEFYDKRTKKLSPDRLIVYSAVLQQRADPIKINYTVKKKGNGWKIYDVNVGGFGLIINYQSNFRQEINKGGIQGLIQSLRDKNKKNTKKYTNSKK